MMPISRPRLQVVQNEEIAKAIATIRKHRPGLINDSMVVTSALVEYALGLESDKVQQPTYQTPYGMTIVRTGHVPNETGIFEFLTRNFNRIAAIFAHIAKGDDDFEDYISRGKLPVYTFVLKGRGYTDFEFIHIATSGSLYEECLTLLVCDFKHYRKDIRINVIASDQIENVWGPKSISEYVPSLDEMANRFFQDENGRMSGTWDLDWEANAEPYTTFEMRDTRYVDYSHALVGLNPSSFGKQKYGVQDLVRSGVLSVERDVLHMRYRCICDGWTEEQQDLDYYELGLIFGKHFGHDAIFSPAQFLGAISLISNQETPNAIVYIEGGKRIEVLPMEWKQSWFVCYLDGQFTGEGGWSLLDDDPNPFRLYDMRDFFPEHLERYKRKKKKPQ